ncbi:MAG: GNAT family N-acetyltransferase [Microthrixaceae bacterium]
MTNPHWPVWDLRVRTPLLELRPLHEPDLPALVELVSAGIHDPATMPFLQPFTDEPSPGRERSTYRFVMRCWAEWSPERWMLPLGVFVDGELVGNQSVEAERFPLRRSVTTGSWLGLAHQGRGIGTEMRAAVLELAFRGLGALRAQTSAYEDNTASLAVTRKVGYSPDGWAWASVREERRRMLRFALDAADWTGRPDVLIEGLGPEALDQFGLS